MNNNIRSIWQLAIISCKFGFNDGFEFLIKNNPNIINYVDDINCINIINNANIINDIDNNESLPKKLNISSDKMQSLFEEKNQDLLIDKNSNNLTLLIVACRYNNYNCVKILLDNNVLILNNILHFAVSKKSKKSK